MWKSSLTSLTKSLAGGITFPLPHILHFYFFFGFSTPRINISPSCIYCQPRESFPYVLDLLELSSRQGTAASREKLAAFRLSVSQPCLKAASLIAAAKGHRTEHRLKILAFKICLNGKWFCRWGVSTWTEKSQLSPCSLPQEQDWADHVCSAWQDLNMDMDVDVDKGRASSGLVQPSLLRQVLTYYISSFFRTLLSRFLFVYSTHQPTGLGFEFAIHGFSI